MKTLLSICFFLSLFSLHVVAQPISISSARSQAIGNEVTVQGTVLNGPELGVIRYVQDATGGIAAYSSTNTLSGVNRGDILQVTGTLFDFNNLLELSPISSFQVISSGNPLPAPQTIAIPDFNETHEAELIRIANVTFLAGGGLFQGSTNYFITDGIDVAQLRIASGSPLIGQTIPTGPVNLTGIGSQFLQSYQLLLRDLNDIEPVVSINITSPLTTSNFTNNSITLNWTTDLGSTSFVKYGLTPLLELGTASGVPGLTAHQVVINNLLPGNIYYCQAFSTLGSDTAFSAVRTFGTISSSGGEIKCYFNDAVNNANGVFSTPAISLINAIDDTLIAYIDRAEQTLDLTIYDFNNTNISSISSAINAAYNRGVIVRFISDGSLSVSNTGVSDLLPSIPRLTSPTGGNYGIMHNKFVIIDANHQNPLKPIVWTGATNWTKRQINTDPNDVIIIQDQTLAKAYTIEFEEMWGSSSAQPNANNAAFGPAKTDNTPHDFIIGGKRVECYFSPSDGTNGQLIQTISSAESELYFASMLITRTDITIAITAARNAGALVQGVVDDATTTTQYNNLMNLLGPSNFVSSIDTNIMHHKYMVVDQINPQSDPLVWTGSHNWTNNANNRNDENVVVVHDRDIANQYYQNFNARLAENGGIILSSKNTSVQPITVFPNPASSAINIAFASESIEPKQYNLADLSGRVVLSGNFLLAETGTEKISLSGLPAGIYMLRIDFDKQSSCTYRIIKTQ